MYTSIVVAHCIAASGYVRRTWVRVAAWVACLLIAASTCFLKQHSVLDAAGAAGLFALVLGAWHVVGRAARRPRRGTLAD